MMGGACQKCGYKKCIASLSFHHKNPKEKDGNWTKKDFNPNDCDLLCLNCHAELHYNELKPKAL